MADVRTMAQNPHTTGSAENAVVRDHIMRRMQALGMEVSTSTGLIDAKGNLQIIDRKKNIFKLSQGEYVAAEKIENIYIKAALVAQAFVYGDSLHAVLVGVVVADPDAAKAWAKANGREGAGAAQLAGDKDFRAAVAAQLEAEAKAAKLQSFEKLKEFVIEPFAWTPEDLLTPSFKLKRADAKIKCVAGGGAPFFSLSR
jgi:long-chain acyl-CoA synthetase